MLIDRGFLDDEQVLNKHVESIATEIASNEQNQVGFQCNQCEKVCINRNETLATRHVNVKASCCFN